MSEILSGTREIVKNLPAHLCLQVTARYGDVGFKTAIEEEIVDQQRTIKAIRSNEHMANTQRSILMDIEILRLALHDIEAL
jgi:hypothetical protein